ncbi:MAG: right-handed parallel beta-helix repeat-containing protein, partial [Planctomycetes bacterium]|nr:right-handed parallel beta-helix repeat-containing protein [Planctomycetota bacterium]
NDGTSWQDAFDDLQDALAISVECDEIWVAAGTYTPDRGTGDRTLSFDIPSGVALYGGFAGWEMQRPQRNWDKNASILSGDLSGDDGARDCEQQSDCCYEHEDVGCDDAICADTVCSVRPDCCVPGVPGFTWDDICAAVARDECCHLGNWNTCENSFYVVTMDVKETPTILDGFTIRSAYASVRDGLNIFPFGILDQSRGSQISNCLFTNNYRGAGSTGGVFTKNTFRDSVMAGLLGTDVTVTDCRFVDNVGGIAMSGISSLTRCTFEGQTLVAVTSTGDVTIDRCSFLDNPGDGYHATSGTARVSDCVFSRTGLNAIVAFTTTMNLERIAFLGNLQAPLVVIRTAVRAEDCLFSGNRANGGIVGIIAGFAEFDRCTFHGNRAFGILLRAISLTSSGASATIRNSIIWGADGDPSGTEDALLKDADTSNLSIDYSIVQGWTGKLGGVGNS